MSTETLAPVAPRGLTAEQVNLLLQMIHEGRVRQLNGFDHVEAWDVRRWLTRIFGFAGWSEECLTEKVVYERITQNTDGQGKPVEGKFRATVVYQVVLRLHIRDVYGNELGFFDQGSAGESVNQPSIGDAYDNALKNAFSGALKRCAIDLGDQFGLSLYDKGRKRAAEPQPAVLRTLGHPQALAAPVSVERIVDAPVTSGEMDDQVAGEEHTAAVEVQRTQAVTSAGSRPQVQRTHVPADEPADAGPRMADGQQKQMMGILFGQKLNADREERLRVISGSLGREVTTASDMTYAEAQACLGWLRGLPDFNPPQPSPTATDSLFEEFKVGIEGSASVTELNSVATGIGAAFQAHKLTEADRKALIEVWTERNKVLLDQAQMAGAAA